MATKKNSSKRNEMSAILASMEARLTALFGARYQEVLRISQVRKAIEAGEDFTFESSPAAARQMEVIVRQLAMQTTSIIKQGDKEAWEAGDKTASRTLAATFGKTSDGKATLDALTERGLEDQRQRGATAAGHYRQRQEAVNYSTGVWKEQAQKDIELLIQNGIKQGKSAEQISRDIRPFLNNPTAHYRRVRNKETGELELSKAAKGYHPGAGVYRSAFKNAMRLARTEVNIAYATAQWEAFQSNPLVTGIRISLSNNHTTLNSKGQPVPLHDICDELAGDYPKTFRWTPWHPQCRCTMTPITISENDFKSRMKALFSGALDDWKPQDTVTKMPESFTGWMERNKERLAAGRSVPAFIRDNFRNGDPLAALSPAITQLEAEVKKQETIQPITDFDNEVESLRRTAATYGLDIEKMEILRQAGKDKEALRKEIDSLMKERDRKSAQWDAAIRKAGAAYTKLAKVYSQLQALDYESGVLDPAMLSSLKQALDNEKRAKDCMASIARCADIETRCQEYAARIQKEIDRIQKEQATADDFKKTTFDTLDERGQLNFLIQRLQHLNSLNMQTEILYNIQKYRRIADDSKATKAQLQQAINMAKKDLEKLYPDLDANAEKNMREYLTGKQKTQMDPKDFKNNRRFAALIGETEEKAREISESVHSFTNKWDFDIRAYQSGIKFTPSNGHTKAQVKQKAETIEAFIRKAPAWTGESYRGIYMTDAELAPYLNPGYVFDMRGMSSWSVKKSIAVYFSEKEAKLEDCKVVFICKKGQPRGTSIRGISDYVLEQEILTSSTARWRVISGVLIDPTNKTYEITCEPV